MLRGGFAKVGCRKLYPARGCYSSHTAQVSIPRAGVGTEGMVLEMGLSLAGAARAGCWRSQGGTDCRQPRRVLVVHAPVEPHPASGKRIKAGAPGSRFVGDATETCFNLSEYSFHPN